MSVTRNTTSPPIVTTASAQAGSDRDGSVAAPERLDGCAATEVEEWTEATGEEERECEPDDEAEEMSCAEVRCARRRRVTRTASGRRS